ncbi:hypothetical protein FRB90_000790 [Tulasnella sp. 427]|nr:hypothetical protein FRB90_000790 [Tulasnella sp. 427]
MNTNQPALMPDIYRLGCLYGDGQDATLFLHHSGVNQPVLAKTGVEDLPAQEWVLTPKPGSPSLYSMYNIQSGQYLSLVCTQAQGADSIFWWTVVQDGMNYSIVSGDSALETQGCSDGAQVGMESTSSSTQRWTAIPVMSGKYGPYWLKSKEPQTYLALEGGSYANKTHARGYKMTPERKANLSFQWRLIPAGPGGSNLVRIQNVCSSTCLMRHGGPVCGAVQISGWQKVDHKWVAKPAPGEPSARIFQVEGTNSTAQLYAGDPRDGNDATIWDFKDPNHVRQNDREDSPNLQHAARQRRWLPIITHDTDSIDSNLLPHRPPPDVDHISPTGLSNAPVYFTIPRWHFPLEPTAFVPLDDLSSHHRAGKDIIIRVYRFSTQGTGHMGERSNEGLNHDRRPPPLLSRNSLTPSSSSASESNAETPRLTPPNIQSPQHPVTGLSHGVSPGIIRSDPEPRDREGKPNDVPPSAAFSSSRLHRLPGRSSIRRQVAPKEPSMPDPAKNNDSKSPSTIGVLALLECSVCQRTLESPTTLRCGHTVCSAHVQLVPTDGSPKLESVPLSRSTTSTSSRATAGSSSSSAPTSASASAPTQQSDPLANLPSCPIESCAQPSSRYRAPIYPTALPSSRVTYFPPPASGTSASGSTTSLASTLSTEASSSVPNRPKKVASPRLDITIAKILQLTIGVAREDQSRERANVVPPPSEPQWSSDDDDDEEEEERVVYAFPNVLTDRRLAIEEEERNARLDTPVFTPNPAFGMIMPPRTNAPPDAEEYGTMLEIKSVQMLPDGRSMVETRGTHRFRIAEKGVLDGYMVARIVRMDDLPEDADDLLERTLTDAQHATSPEPTVEELMQKCREFYDQLRDGTAPWVVQQLNNTYGPMPEDPSTFGFWMAMIGILDMSSPSDDAIRYKGGALDVNWDQPAPTSTIATTRTTGLKYKKHTLCVCKHDSTMVVDGLMEKIICYIV